MKCHRLHIYAIVAALLICGCSFDEARQMQQRAYLDATRWLPANVLSDIETYFERECDESRSCGCRAVRERHDGTAEAGHVLGEGKVRELRRDELR